MKVTDKKFLNIHHTIGPMMTGGYSSVAATANPAAAAAAAAAAAVSADGLAAKAADKLLVSS